MPTPEIQVPFFRPDVRQPEIDEVVATLESGWLTTGPRVKRFEEEFAEAVGARHALALNSCTAALHLGVVALGLQPGQAVLVPAMTMAATAEVLRYQGAEAILVDCDPVTLNLDFDDAERKLQQLARGELPVTPGTRAVGIIPVHVGGLMLDLARLREFADRHGLWIVEDAAHAFPAAWRASEQDAWQRCGEGSGAVSCFSFYANKCITTGEGGMATTDSEELLERMRPLSLHGLSSDAWGRFSAAGSWDYRIVAPGFKYNLTDIAAAIGIHQLARAESMRQDRERLAHGYLQRLADVEELELPPVVPNRLHAWHLFVVRLRLDRLRIDRNTFLQELRKAGVGYSVHWRPLQCHPYYQETLGWREDLLPQASGVWQRLVTLPLFPTMTDAELDHVVTTLRRLCRDYSRDQRPGTAP